MKKLAVVSLLIGLAATTFAAGTSRFGKMKDKDWVVTNAWQAMSHRVTPDSAWATNHFESTQFSNAVNRTVVIPEIYTQTNVVKDIVKDQLKYDSSTDNYDIKVSNAIEALNASEAAYAYEAGYADEAEAASVGSTLALSIAEKTTTNQVCNLITNNVAPWAMYGKSEPQGITTNDVLALTSAKRDLTNNVCAADSFTAWGATPPSGYTFGDAQPVFNGDTEKWTWYVEGEGVAVDAESGASTASATSATFTFEDSGTKTFTATRSKVAVSNDTFTTYAFVKTITNGLASAEWVLAKNYVDKSVTNGLASETWVTNKIAQIPVGTDTNAVKGIVESASVTNAGAYVAATNAAAASAAGKYLPATPNNFNYLIRDSIALISESGYNNPSAEFYGSVIFNGGSKYIASDGTELDFFGGASLCVPFDHFFNDTYYQSESISLQSALDAKADATNVYTKAQITGNTVTNGGAKAYADTANATTRAIVTQWESFLDGSNVVFSITNYQSGAYSTDYAKLRILELTNNVYREVYSSHTDIEGHIALFRTNEFATATNAVITTVAAAIAEKADKAWGKYSSDGTELSTLGYSNTVYMTAPNTVFAGGLEYERVAVGEGCVCVLTTKGAPVWTQGDEGTFKFQSDGGTNYFGFAKTDSYTIGCDADGISVSNNMVHLTYEVIMTGYPCIWYKSSLASSSAWEQLNLPDGTAISGASHGVSWTTSGGSKVAHINVTGEAQGFFRATIEVAGEAKFITNMPADLAAGIICTNTATGVNGVIKPTFNGTTVQWNWSAL